MSAGDPSSLALQSMLSGQNLPVGTGAKKFVPLVTVSERWERMDCNPSDQVKNELKIKPTTTTAMLGGALDVSFEFVVELKSRTDFAAALGAKSAAAPAGTFARGDPFWGLSNIKLNPNPARSMIQQWVLRHNTTEVIKSEGHALSLDADLQYDADEQELIHGLENGYCMDFVTEGKLGACQVYWDESYVRKPGAVNPRTGLRFGKWRRRPVTSPYLNTFVLQRLPGNAQLQQPLAGQAWPTQLEQIRARHQGIDLTDAELVQKYRQNFYHEICLRDLNRADVNQDSTAEIPIATAALDGKEDTGLNGRPAIPFRRNADDTYVLKSIDDIAQIYGGKKIRFHLTYRVQTPWHRHPAHAHPQLNLVNDPEFIFTLHDWKRWIQNWGECGHLIQSLTIEKPEAKAKLYDVPKNIWDAYFPVTQQRSYFLNDIRQTHHDREAISFHGTGDPDEEHTPQHTQNHFVKINEHDKLCRMLVVEAEPLVWSTTPENAPALPTIDLIDRLWLEIGADILGKVPADWLSKFKDEFSHFTRDRSSVRECWFKGLGFDNDVENFGGGAVDFSTIYNNTRIGYNLSTARIERYATDPHLRPLYVNKALGDTVDDMYGPNDQYLGYGNWCQDGLGSLFGCINAVLNADQKGYTYTVAVRFNISALGVKAVIHDSGQLYPHQQT
jgi:hypothetical protein